MTKIMRIHYKAQTTTSPWKNYDLALEAATRAAPYWHRKLPAAVEVTGAEGSDLLIQVVKFGDPNPIPTIDADTDTGDDALTVSFLTYRPLRSRRSAGCRGPQ